MPDRCECVSVYSVIIFVGSWECGTESVGSSPRCIPAALALDRVQFEGMCLSVCLTVGNWQETIMRDRELNVGRAPG